MAVASKRIRTREQKCIICSKKVSISELTKPKDQESRDAILKAALIHKFHPMLDFEEYDKKLYYHRDCRATFTHTKKLQSLIKHSKKPTCSTDSTKISTRSREPVPTLPTRVLEDLCIFCDNKNEVSSL